MRPSDSKVGGGAGDKDVLASSGRGIVVGERYVCLEFSISVPTTNDVLNTFSILILTLQPPTAMTENRVIVTYTTASSLLSTETWKQIHTALKVQFPLRNIHWKPPSASSILTIQELDVKLVPFENVRDEHASQIPMTLLEKPLLHIYVVACEVSDTLNVLYMSLSIEQLYSQVTLKHTKTRSRDKSKIGITQ